MNKNSLILCAMCGQFVQAWYMKAHMTRHHPEALVDFLKSKVWTQIEEMQQPEARGNQSSAETLTGPKRSSRATPKPPRLKEAGISLKPVALKSGTYVTDESGRQVSYQFWIDNKNLGDSTGHAAQSSDIRPPKPAFEQIASVPNTYYKGGHNACPVCGMEVTQLDKHIHKRHRGKKIPDNTQKSISDKDKPAVKANQGLPVLVLRESAKPHTPHGGLTTRARWEQLTIPCLFCGQPVLPSKWWEHMDTCYPHHADKVQFKVFLQQKVICSICSTPLSFEKTKRHYIDHHKGWEVVGIKAPKPTVKSNKSEPASKPDGSAIENLTLSETNHIKLQKLRQSLDEEKDGGKYLGYLRREADGKFGSFPLHDDYGDESDAE